MVKQESQHMTGSHLKEKVWLLDLSKPKVENTTNVSLKTGIKFS